MERRNSYYRLIYVFIVVLWIVDVRNKWEILLFVEIRKGLFGKKDRIIWIFYREKVKENNFLWNICCRSFGILIVIEYDGYGEIGIDEKISFIRRNVMIDKKVRC